jgi:hypothetical protein
LRRRRRTPRVTPRRGRKARSQGVCGKFGDDVRIAR